METLIDLLYIPYEIAGNWAASGQPFCDTCMDPIKERLASGVLLTHEAVILAVILVMVLVLAAVLFTRNSREPV